MYRPPYSDAHPVTTSVFFSEFTNLLESITLSNDPLLITGDFNIHVDCTDNLDSIKFLDLLESTGLKQHVRGATHCSGHTLDLIITRQTDNIITSIPRVDHLFSDHNAVLCILESNAVPLTQKHISFRKLKSVNTEALKGEISCSDLCKNPPSNLTDLVSCYNNTMMAALTRHAPLISKTIVTRPVVPWYNDEIKCAKRMRRRAERKWRRTKLLTDFLAFKTAKNQTTFLMNQARQSFYRQFISENSQDQRKLFCATKSLFRHDSDLAFPRYNDSTALSNDLGQFFVQKIIKIRSELDTAVTCEQVVLSDMPSVSLNSDHIFQEFSLMSEDDTKRLITSSNKKSSSLDPIPTKLVIECLDVLLPVITKMINLSLESGIFPCIWKEADVQPRLKKQGLEVLFENLRPISNLPYVSKLVERTVRNQFHNHLSVHHLYPGNQSAYREFHSTETALLRVKNDILMNMNKQHVTLLVLLDLSAAFDTVDHALLLHRLQLKFGLSGTVLKWFTS